ncbi:phosphotransferase [Candidatus Uhrbacteria bacterium]|nr:phosphotransferase [Candidatus Uhrbacteria bacterium]
MSFEMVNPFAEIKREHYTLRLLPGAKNDLPPEFIDKAYEFALSNAKKLKHVDKTDTGVEGVNEIVWKMTDQDGYSFVLKLTQPDKTPDPDHELRILDRAHKAGLPSPKPLGMMHVGTSDFLMMEYVPGRSGQDIWDKLIDEGWSAGEIEAAQIDAERLIKQVVDTYRQALKIDKPWYIKDFLLTFDGRKLKSVFPLDFERAHTFDPVNPEKIRVVPKVAKPIRKAA